MSEHNQLTDLSEPLNPGASDRQLTAKELSEWLVCTSCYPKETTSKDPAEIARAKAQPAEAMVKLHKQYGGEDGIIRHLDTNKDRGITQASVEQRRMQYGTNKPLERATKTVCDMILENLGDHFMILLMVAASVELALGIWQEGWASGWVDGVSIFLAVVIITTVNVVNSYKTEQTFKKLMEAEDDVKVDVKRDGELVNIHVNDVVVGDLLKCQNAKKLSADGIVVDAKGMSVNESDMTGEKDLMEKTPYRNEHGQGLGTPFLFKGCIVTDGEGWMIVTSVGTNTNEGQMQKQMDFESEPTPLQRKLNTIVEWIGIIGIVSAALVFLALTLRLVFDIWAFGTRSVNDESNLTEITQAFIVAVTVVVMAVPEGLPLAVTISLQFSISDLESKYNTLIRRPDATETMGGCTEICSDKTGTLTANSMTTMAFWVEDKIYDNYDYKKELNDDLANCHDDMKKLNSLKTIAAGILTNSSTFEITIKEGKNAGQKALKGNPTEKALFEFFTATDCDMSNDYAAELEQAQIFKTPFDSKKKFSVVAYRLKDGKVRIVVKGAPDFVIKHCTQVEKSHGRVEQLTERELEKIQGKGGVISQFAKKSYRTIIACYKDMSRIEWDLFIAKHNVNASDKEEQLRAREALECSLTISGIFGIEDPLRDGINTTISKLKRAGVRTRMCTGDNVETARSICLKAGIILDDKDESAEIQDRIRTDAVFANNRKKYQCMTGEEFRKEFGVKDEEEGTWSAKPKKHYWQTQIIDHLKCLARSSPTDKQILVQGIQKYSASKAIVAVTGDGTNDCPALKMADVGFAMNDGSDAAKQESKVVLLTNDFNATLICVKFGRNIYDAVQKFLQFQLTVNVVAIAVVLLGAVVLNEKVLTSVQILWVNLIMDTFAALALATEPAVDSLLERAPTNRDESIVSSVMARNILGWSVYQIGTLCAVLFAGKNMFDLKYRDEDPFFWAKRNGIDDETGICGTVDLATGNCAIVGDGTEKLVMYTMVFNLFVWLQVFNQFNARKIKGELNVWSGLTDNCWFIGISLITVVVQILAIYFGGRPLRCVPLDMNQQLLTIGLAVGILPWNLLCSQIPASWCSWASNCVPNKEQDDEEATESSIIGMSGRASARMSKTSLSMQNKFLKKILQEKQNQQEQGFKTSLN